LFQWKVQSQLGTLAKDINSSHTRRYYFVKTAWCWATILTIVLPNFQD
jgi:hypothetical protein